MRTRAQEDRRKDRKAGGQEDRRTGGQEDRRTEGKEERRTEVRRTGGQGDRRTVFSFCSASFCQVSLLSNCNLPMSVYKYTLFVLNLQLRFLSVYKYTAPRLNCIGFQA